MCPLFLPWASSVHGTCCLKLLSVNQHLFCSVVCKGWACGYANCLSITVSLQLSLEDEEQLLQQATLGDLCR